MLNRISCLIISPNISEYDLSLLRYDDKRKNSEKNFDIFTALSSEEGLQILSNKHYIDTIISIGNVDEKLLAKYGIMENFPYFSIESFNADVITNLILEGFFRKLEKNEPIFTFITPVYNTPQRYIERLYNSLVNQSIAKWEWIILDDSTNKDTAEYIASLYDYRITVLKNFSVHGNIGFNKNNLGMMANGKWIIEIDHDDEIVPNALQIIYDAINTYPDSDFIYSDDLELIDGEAIDYGDNFSLGQGTYRNETIMGKNYKVAISSPSINPKSIRAIYAEPNHIRIWKKDFYHKIGGHNKNLSVLDDMDLMIRTFLNGKMTHINKTLYIQHEDGSANGRGDTAQGHRFAEIQRTNWLLYGYYDKLIHNRILELGYEDTIWNEEGGYSEWWKEDVELPVMSNEYYPE